MARSTVPCSGVRPWLRANASPCTRTTSAISNGGRAPGAGWVGQEATGYARWPAFFLGAILFAAIFTGAGSFSSGLLVAAVIAVLTRV